SLADFVAAGKIRSAGIDVYEKEPCTESPLHEFENVVLTPHLGASTKEAQSRAGIQTAEYVAAGLEGSIVPTAVNMAPVPPEVMDLVGPYVPACQMMGSMLAQIDGEVPQFLMLTASGTIADADPSILVAGTLGGMLSYRAIATVTPVNADAVARRHGIKIDTLSRSDAAGYASAVTLVADGTEISCSLTDAGHTPRIVSLFGYKIDIAPATQSLIFEYVDAPGRIGVIGTILGEAGINITTMQVGLKPEEQNALVYVNVEGEVTDDILAKLREGLGELKNLWYVKI
ncbi:MAG: NAD(P)-dependent oxidoreductase, partial [Raoultibacter sp.]